MLLAQNERGILAKIGFALARGGVVAEAEQIFAGLAESEPGRDGPIAGLALCSVIRGEFEAALDMIDKRLAHGSPIADELALYKVLALGMAGRLAEAKAVRDVMTPDGARAADALLDDFEKRQ